MKYMRMIKGKRLWICMAAAVLTAVGLSFVSMAKENAGDVYGRLLNTQQGVSREEAGSTRYSSYRSGKQDKDDTKNGLRSSSPEDKFTGPGAGSTINVIQDEDGSGPAVKEISLSENYHEDYGVYEENMGDVFFIYTNVENGGITDRAVTLDIPANLAYTAQKDGTPITYTSGQPISASGSYSFRFTGTADASAAFSKQTIYKSSFRFRIQAKLPEAVKQSESQMSQNGDLWGGRWAGGEGAEAVSSGKASGNIGSQRFGEDSGEDGDSETSSAQAAGDQMDGLPGDREESGLKVMGEDGKIDSEALDKTLDRLVNGDDKEDKTEALKPSGISTSFDEDMGFYRNELASGAVFYTNVPNGMVTNYQVSLKTSDEITFTVYKDGQKEEFDPGAELEEAGSYTIVPVQTTTAYVSRYANGKTPVFQFRIVKDPVRDLDVVNAPQNMTFSSVTLEGKELSDIHSDFLHLQEDGAYEVTMSGEGGPFTVEIVRDTVQPRFHVQTVPNRAFISYLSSDVIKCTLYKNGKVTEEGGILSNVDGKGDYTLQVYDAAGNMSSATFTVSYQPNTGAVIGIVLLIAIVVLLLMYVVRMRKQVKVR